MNDEREFKINLEAADTEDDFNASRIVKKPEQQRHVRYAPSITVLFAFMILGIALIWMYYYFSSRLVAVNTEGSSGIASLSSEFTSKVSELSQQLMDQKQSVQTQLKGMEAQLGKLKSAVSSLKNSKTDIKDMDAAVSGIKKTIAPLQGSLTQLEEQLNGINRKTGSAAASLKQIETSVSKNTSDISKLNESRLDKGYIDQKIKEQRALQQQQLSASSESLLKEIASLETKLSNMKQRLATMENQLSKRTAIPNKLPSSTSQKSGKRPSSPKPGEIIEQDLK